MIAAYGIIAAVIILLFWGVVLWAGARLDRPYLEAERARKVFGDERSAVETGDSENG